MWLTSKFQTLFLKQWMDCLPRNYRYEQITGVLEDGINEETGELAISKKKSEGEWLPHILTICGSDFILEITEY